MDDIRQTAIDRFRAYLERRQFSAHTVASYTIDLRLFFAVKPHRSMRGLLGAQRRSAGDDTPEESRRPLERHPLDHCQCADSPTIIIGPTGSLPRPA